MSEIMLARGITVDSNFIKVTIHPDADLLQDEPDWPKKAVKITNEATQRLAEMLPVSLVDRHPKVRAMNLILTACEEQGCRPLIEKHRKASTLWCSRTDCKEELGFHAYRIFNRSQNPPRDYCLGCGKRILGEPCNRGLRYQIVNIVTGEILKDMSFGEGANQDQPESVSKVNES